MLKVEIGNNAQNNVTFVKQGGDLNISLFRNLVQDGLNLWSKERRYTGTRLFILHLSNVLNFSWEMTSCLWNINSFTLKLYSIREMQTFLMVSSFFCVYYILCSVNRREDQVHKRENLKMARGLYSTFSVPSQFLLLYWSTSGHWLCSDIYRLYTHIRTLL